MSKDFELKKYHDLIIATIDYYIKNVVINKEFENIYLDLKLKTEENFSKGRLSTLKRYFKYLTSDFIEDRDFYFNEYLKKTTNHEINIFESYFKRVEKTIDKGKIKTENQFTELNNYVDYLIQTNDSNKELINRINEILLNYENSKLNNN